MPRRREIENRITNEYISMQDYSGLSNELFSPNAVFEKWAVVEVSTHDSVPDGMAIYSLNGGRYAVFIHKGPAIAGRGVDTHQVAQACMSG